MKTKYKILIILPLLFNTLNALTLNTTIKETIKNNSQIQSNNLQNKSKLYDIEIQKAGFYPSINLNSYFQKSQTKDDLDGQKEANWLEKDGHRTTLSLEQLIYDGSNQSSKRNESKYDYSSSKFSTITQNEDLVLEATKSYLILLQEQNLKLLNTYSIDEHNKALEIAFDQEEISGEILESKKTQALIGDLNEEIYDKKQLQIKEYANFFNLTSLIPKDKLCKPDMNRIFVPATLQEAIDYAILNNTEIKKQEELIKKQRTLIEQTTSSYKPTIKLKFDASYDSDLELAESGNQKELNGKIDLNWNLYNGGKDSTTKDKQKILLLGEIKKLEIIKQDITKNIIISYNSYQNSYNRMKNLLNNIIVNEKILELNRNQLEDGTKSFLNVLSAQIKIVKMQEKLIKQTTKHYENYYSLLNELSILTKVILLDKSNLCNSTETKNLIIKENPVVEDELDDLLDDNTSENDEFKILGNDINLSDLTITLQFGKSLFGQDKKDKKAKDFINKMDEISTSLLYILNKDGDKIKEIELRSYSSSEYRSKKTQEAKDKANFDLSEKRVKLLKDYFLNKAEQEGYDTNEVEKRLVLKPIGAKDFIYSPDGKEDIEASRRIVIKIIK